MEASFGSKPAGFGTPDCGPKPLRDLLQGLPIASRQIFWDSFYHQPKPTNSIPKLTRFDRFDKGEAFLDKMNFATVISGMACPFWSNTSRKHLNHANWPWVIFGQSNVETRRPNGSVLPETTWFQNPWEKLISFDQKLERQKYSIGFNLPVKVYVVYVWRMHMLITPPQFLNLFIVSTDLAGQEVGSHVARCRLEFAKGGVLPRSSPGPLVLLLFVGGGVSVPIFPPIALFLQWWNTAWWSFLARCSAKFISQLPTQLVATRNKCNISRSNENSWLFRFFNSGLDCL